MQDDLGRDDQKGLNLSAAWLQGSKFSWDFGTLSLTWFLHCYIVFQIADLYGQLKEYGMTV